MVRQTKETRELMEKYEKSLITTQQLIKKLPNKIFAEVVSGAYKGKTITIVFGDKFWDTHVFLNGKELNNVASFVLYVNANNPPIVTLRFLEI